MSGADSRTWQCCVDGTGFVGMKDLKVRGSLRLVTNLQRSAEARQCAMGSDFLKKGFGRLLHEGVKVRPRL